MSKSQSSIGVIVKNFLQAFREPQLILMKLTFQVSLTLLFQPTTQSFSLQPFRTPRLENKSCGNNNSKPEINEKNNTAYVWLLELPKTSWQTCNLNMPSYRLMDDMRVTILQ